MNIVVLTPVRLMGDGLVACFGGQPDIRVTAVVDSLDALRAILQSPAVDLVLVDVTQGIDLYDIRGIAFEHPEISLVALGLDEQRQEVIRCGRRGYAGYVARNASVETLCHALMDVVQGRLACPAEISGSLTEVLVQLGSSQLHGRNCVGGDRGQRQPLRKRLGAESSRRAFRC